MDDDQQARALELVRLLSVEPFELGLPLVASAAWLASPIVFRGSGVIAGSTHDSPVLRKLENDAVFYRANAARRRVREADAAIVRPFEAPNKLTLTQSVCRVLLASTSEATIQSSDRVRALKAERLWSWYRTGGRSKKLAGQVGMFWALKRTLASPAAELAPQRVWPYVADRATVPSGSSEHRATIGLQSMPAPMPNEGGPGRFYGITIEPDR